MVLGSRGGIGSCVCELASSQGFDLLALDRCHCDLADPNHRDLIWELLDQYQPRVIINCAGVYDRSWDLDLDPMMRVNFGSNWSIIRWAAKNPRDLRIIMLGSSAHDQPRAQHMLYAATKSATHSLWQSARDFFGKGPVKIDIVHPVRTKTPMTRSSWDSGLDFLDPRSVAQEIMGLVIQNGPSSCLEINFKEPT